MKRINWPGLLPAEILILVLITIFTALAITSCAGENKPAPAGDEGEWELVWSDGFEGTELDSSKWEYQLGTGAEYGLTGWGNNELQFYTGREKNVYLENGHLFITALEENFEGMDYTSGRIRTLNKGDWKFGKIEARAKLPEGQGIWPAIWMMPTEQVYGGWPKSGEIDIMELVGHKPSVLHGTVHFGPDWPENEQISASTELQNGTFGDSFHLFGIEWEEDEIRWYLDGKEYHRVTSRDLDPFHYPFNEKFHLIMNLAVGGNWPGNPDSTTVFPQSLIVDYVRVYQKTSN